MKYSEMTKFLNDNGIEAMQPVIANEVNAQLETEISESEFEDVCATVYGVYLDCFDEPDIFDLVRAELLKRGLQQRRKWK